MTTRKQIEAQHHAARLLTLDALEQTSDQGIEPHIALSAMLETLFHATYGMAPDFSVADILIKDAKKSGKASAKSDAAGV